MYRFKNFVSLEEARKNPDQNPKESAYELLKPYAQNPDIYISFTYVDKLGLNPSSAYFTTPLAIYTYPLKEVWAKYGVDAERSLTVLPFAAKNPYIWVLKSKNKGFVRDMYTDYTSAAYDTDLVKLKAIWEKMATADRFAKKDAKLGVDGNDTPHVDALVKSAEGDVSKVFDRDVAPFQNDNAAKVTKDADRVNAKHTQVKTHATRVRDYANGNKNASQPTWDELVQIAHEQRKEANPIMTFWSITERMAEYITGETARIGKITTWSSILKQCGYSGFGDKSGRGYIHTSEPTQAIFLDMTAFDIVGKVFNKDYKLTIQTFRNLLELVGTDTKKALKLLIDLGTHYRNCTITVGDTPVLLGRKFIITTQDVLDFNAIIYGYMGTVALGSYIKTAVELSVWYNYLIEDEKIGQDVKDLMQVHVDLLDKCIPDDYNYRQASVTPPAIPVDPDEPPLT
jgi:hypothetical protein